VDEHKLIIQSIGKAALKTFVQAGVGTVGVFLLAWVAVQTTNISNGGNVRDIDWTPLLGFLAMFCLAGIAALTSLAMNWSKRTTQPPVVVNEPVVVDK
jgi:hypothetical protein